MKLRWLATLASGVMAAAILAAPAAAQSIDEIDFGDDSSNWANDGECDDPRFEGEGMAGSPLREDRNRDASDCRALFEQGQITFAASQYDPSLTVFNGVQLGDDSGRYPNDGQCDDPRFIGEGMAISPDHPEILKDRTDCSYGFQLGELVLADQLPPPLEAVIDGIEFGNDKGSYVSDSECDDPRFAGPGMAGLTPQAINIGKDRTDCLAAYNAGTVRFIEKSVIDGFDFGDDGNFYAGDGECDDPRFAGNGMGAKPNLSGIRHDATDCMAAWQAGTIRPVERLEAAGYLIRKGLFFGNDSSVYANDGECDDPGFVGRSMAGDGGSTDHAGKDRTDCLAGYESGSLKAAPPVPVLHTLSVDGIQFGDDTSAFANDGECDDPRFTGEGMAASPTETHRNHDASDCLVAYQGGTITLRN